jgi:hypothetical protein
LYGERLNSMKVIVTSVGLTFGTRGTVVLKALCYKPEDRGFETREDFFILIKFESAIKIYIL